MYRPDFPVTNSLELQRSRIAIGDSRRFGWETSYSSAMTPKTREPGGLDASQTKALQRSHWNPGDAGKTGISEMKASYQRLAAGGQQTVAKTRDDLMRTSFQLGDGTPMESRAVAARGIKTAVEPRKSLRDQMVSTHFDLKSPAEPSSGWKSTNKSDFRPTTVHNADRPRMELQRGLDMKATFENMGSFGTPVSSTQEAYQNPRAQTAVTRNRSVSIQDGMISFGENTTNKWQRTNMKLGDSQTTYSTSTGDALKHTPTLGSAVDPHYASRKRLEASKSSAGQGHFFPSVTESIAHSAVKSHPGFKPPEISERTAFTSHHDFSNWTERPSTTMRASYSPKPLQPTEPINHRLQESHAKLGSDNVREMSTLYSDTFKKLPPSVEKADIQAARSFHMGHHVNNKSGDKERTEISTNQATYTGCKDGHASAICDSLRGGHNIVPDDPRFYGTKSSMKDSFPPPRKVEVPAPVNNALQKSHIQLQGETNKWTTSQQDYFQFRTYKMPGQPF